MHKKQKWCEQSTSSIIETYWSLKFLKSLNLKLSHLCMHRCYTVASFWPREIFLTSPRFHLSNSNGFGITEKVRGGGEKWFIPTYTLKGCISQKDVPCIIPSRYNTENSKIYWILKKYIENFAFWSLKYVISP